MVVSVVVGVVGVYVAVEVGVVVAVVVCDVVAGHVPQRTLQVVRVASPTNGWKHMSLSTPFVLQKRGSGAPLQSPVVVVVVMVEVVVIVVVVVVHVLHKTGHEPERAPPKTLWEQSLNLNPPHIFTESGSPLQVPVVVVVVVVLVPVTVVVVTVVVVFVAVVLVTLVVVDVLVAVVVDSVLVVVDENGHALQVSGQCSWKYGPKKLSQSAAVIFLHFDASSSQYASVSSSDCGASDEVVEDVVVMTEVVETSTHVLHRTGQRA